MPLAYISSTGRGTGKILVFSPNQENGWPLANNPFKTLVFAYFILVYIPTDIPSSLKPSNIYRINSTKISSHFLRKNKTDQSEVGWRYPGL